MERTDIIIVTVPKADLKAILQAYFETKYPPIVGKTITIDKADLLGSIEAITVEVITLDPVQVTV